MKKLQTSYTVLSILFMSISSSLYGYAAIYLQESGLNNTQIGIVKGGGCILLVLLSSRITALVQRVEALTTRKLCLILYALISGIVLLFLSVKLSVYPLMLLYMVAILLQLTLMPLTANMAMEYIRDGDNLNFGFSRGMGLLFYAITAVILGRLAGELLQGASYGLFMSVIAYYVADHLDLADQMLGQTCVTVFIGGAGAFAGNILGGILQDAFGLSALFLFVCIATAGGSLFVQYLLHVRGVGQRSVNC